MKSDEEEIFCDDESRFQMIKRVFKGRVIPLILIFFLIILPQIFLQGSLNGRANHILFMVFIVMSVLYLIMFVWFGYNLYKYFKSLYK